MIYFLVTGRMPSVEVGGNDMAQCRAAVPKRLSYVVDSLLLQGSRIELDARTALAELSSIT
jgi:hypothetical protein